LRAGLPVTDVEFVQFHPTVMWTGPDQRGQQALVSEAVRGEGAILFDAVGERVMEGAHPLGDLAPRDVVAAAITRRMAEAVGGVDDHVFLDATHLGERFYARFPSITEACRKIGIDPARDRIPVAPASHYACGGIRAGLDGSTSMRGLYAAGEVSRTGVHGANRLASNSLTESVVTGTRVGRDLAWEVPDHVDPDPTPLRPTVPERLVDPDRLREVRAVMSRHVAVLRDAGSLAAAAGAVGSMTNTLVDDVPPSLRAWEATNLLTVASAVIAAASARTESRGCHRRSDFPEPDDRWRTSIDVRLDAVGAVELSGLP
ncbi:MAG: FAD-binding protein, partial [Ilumatobacteraceae bacterium]